MMLYLIISIAIGFCLGVYVERFVFVYSSVNDRFRQKAMCKKFKCNRKDFSYFVEDEDGYYIVVFENKEFRVKFSMNQTVI
ncbi:hypothetical protein [Enterococcus hirae]|uniref:hypothetical protein n=1 Tax=Enterococcus hirae TaxID=1354 RepID=UPI001A9662E4|nr:hypothetical protein [Enterococcus hirae]MBO1102863.1 hypothetical protein [Enterococcus hirae]